ncbi:MAG: guanylate kinase [Lachnospiraceae bacterium]|nr:guanylate kinase [Lachnospiraceae bacterium]
MIYLIMGKSSTGKDTIFEEMLADTSADIRRMVGYTTRPKRSHEMDGREYFFVSREKMLELEAQKKVIERRTYHTVHGDWDYFTVDDGSVADNGRYLYIGTLDSYVKLRDYYGEEKVRPVYIEVEDGKRLSRALKREMEQEKPKYAELCRRYLADEADFSEENLRRCGIRKRYQNNGNLSDCMDEIKKDICG